jgi:hypothetical protein
MYKGQQSREVRTLREAERWQKRRENCFVLQSRQGAGDMEITAEKMVAWQRWESKQDTDTNLQPAQRLIISKGDTVPS